jgi:Protein of unknown function (DUF3223)
MGKARRIVLKTRTFEKAGDATAFFSDMLNVYPIGGRVSEEHALHLNALLERHNERDEKIGCGIDYFKVDTPPDNYPGKCFWIVRSDGTTVDISFNHCLEARPSD